MKITWPSVTTTSSTEHSSWTDLLVFCFLPQQLSSGWSAVVTNAWADTPSATELVSIQSARGWMQRLENYKRFHLKNFADRIPLGVDCEEQAALRQDPHPCIWLLKFDHFLNFIFAPWHRKSRGIVCENRLKNSKEKLVKCATKVARFHTVSTQRCRHNRPSPKVQSHSRNWSLESIGTRVLNWIELNLLYWRIPQQGRTLIEGVSIERLWENSCVRSDAIGYMCAYYLKVKKRQRSSRVVCESFLLW